MALPKNLSFEDWVKHIFDHEVDTSKLEWYWDVDAEFWDETANPTKTVEYLTQLFENIDTIAQSYTDAQMNQGLWFLSTNAASSYMFAPLDQKVSWELRERFANSIFTLNEKLFLPKCTLHLGHLLQEYPPDMNPLNSVCYMFWDISPFSAQPDKKLFQKWDETLLGVMAKTLELDSDACREGALHGLGHRKHAYPQEVVQIIDDFLAKYHNLRPELVAYAENASKGYIQ